MTQRAGIGDVIVAIDQGTTSTRAIAFTRSAEIVAVAQKELAIYCPQDGWVEQDARAIWADTQSVCRQLLNEMAERQLSVAGIGITNQRETTIIWDRHTGEPVYNAIVWQDRRTAELCDQLKQEIDEDQLRQTTGLLLDPYFCATKISWLLDNVAEARKRAEQGELLFGTVDSYLLWKLTNGAVHATDASNASRTLLFNLQTQEWDDELLQRFAIPQAMLPQVRDNASDFGCTTVESLGQSLPIAAMIGDQQSALVGQACFNSGDLKATYGTGCFMLLNTGLQPRISRHNLLTTVAYRLEGTPYYALEGAIFVAGAAVQWLRDGLKLIDHASESEALARSVADNGGVYFVPALTGLGAPHWRPDARGLLVGITRDTQRGHIARAALEAQAYQTRDIVDALLADLDGEQLNALRIDGGMVANTFVCQMLSDVLQTPVQVPALTEATAWGAASLAGLQLGLFESLDDIARQWQQQSTYAPIMSAESANKLYSSWCTAVQRLL